MTFLATYNTIILFVAFFTLYYLLTILIPKSTYQTHRFRKPKLFLQVS